MGFYAGSSCLLCLKTTLIRAVRVNHDIKVVAITPIRLKMLKGSLELRGNAAVDDISVWYHTLTYKCSCDPCLI